MKTGTTRMETFSDGVISIIITIMVLSLKLPDISHNSTPYQIQHYLRELAPYFGAYVFSFMMIGIFWTNHHYMFHLLEHTDEMLLWQNLFYLFWMSLIPFCTAMIGSNPLYPLAIAVYGFIMMMTTAMLAFMREYTLRRGLVYKDEKRELTRKVYKVSVKAKVKSYIGVLAYLLSIPLAYVQVYLAYLLFIIPPIIFFIPDGIDDEELAERITEMNK